MKNLFPFKILMLFLSVVFFSNCSSHTALKYSRKGEVQKKEFVSEVSFKYLKTLPIIPVEIDGKTYHFLFDTGADICVLSPDLLNEIKHQTLKELKVTDSSKKKQNYQVVTIDNIKIGDVIFEGFTGITSDLTIFQDWLKCKTPFHGIIGNNIFRTGAWSINYQTLKLKFADNISKLQINTKAVSVPIECGKLGPTYISLNILGEQKKFKMDTGSSGSLGANKKLFDKLEINSKLPFTTKKGLKSFSLSGKNYGDVFYVPIPSVQMGSFSMQQKIIEFEESSSNLIGNKIWENFEVTKDWKNCKLYLTPIEAILPDTLEKFDYNIVPDFATEKFYLGGEWIDHPSAFKNGLDKEIIKINEVAINNNQFDFCDFMENQFLALQKQDEIKLVILENGQPKKVILQQHRFFPK